MKLFKITLLAFAFLGALPCLGQKLEVRDFKVTNEATAKLKGSEVIDENSGKRAALIKIFTPFKNDELGFDLGLYQVLGRKQAGPGEVWLYVPEHVMKVKITHPKYDSEFIWFEGVDAEAGTTYTVNLNVEGRDVSLIASANGADIYVDDELQGKSPVNMHMPLGAHHVKAQLGSLLFDDLITLTRDGETTFPLEMVDEDLKYGDVDIVVPNNAEIWFQDSRQGVGSLHKHLKAGSYVVTTKLPDHEDQTTPFNVEAGKTKTVQAAAPIPHLGYLAITTEPEYGVTVMQADTVFNLLPTMQLPVATYDFTFMKRGYHPQDLKVRLEQGETFTDTIRLEKIQYVKKTTGYAAVGFMASGKPGVTFTIGGYYENVNLEASYTLGLGRSKEVEWFDRNDKLPMGNYNYRMDEMAIRAGYQLRFAERFGLTPQLGFLSQRLNAKNKNFPGNGFTQNCLTIDARFSYHPVPHLGFFLTPEYAIPIGTKGDIKEVFSQGGLTRGGFRATIGISVSL